MAYTCDGRFQEISKRLAQVIDMLGSVHIVESRSSISALSDIYDQLTILKEIVDEHAESEV